MQTRSKVEFNRRCETFNEQLTKCSDSEPILEIEIASANYCQVTGGLSRHGRKEKDPQRGKQKESRNSSIT